MVRITYRLVDGNEVSFDIPGDTTPSQFDETFVGKMSELGYRFDAREEAVPVTKRRWYAATLAIVRAPDGSDQ